MRLYYLTGIGPDNRTTPNYALGSGDLLASPNFLCEDAGNFNLQPDSPAINAGLDLGYLHDFNSISYHEATLDIGAFIYTSEVCQRLYLPLVQ
jgi:hypothetical protein